MWNCADTNCYKLAQDGADGLANLCARAHPSVQYLPSTHMMHRVSSTISTNSQILNIYSVVSTEQYLLTTSTQMYLQRNKKIALKSFPEIAIEGLHGLG